MDISRVHPETAESTGVSRWPVAVLVALSLGLSACDQLSVRASEIKNGLADETTETQPSKVVLTERLQADALMDGRRFVGELLPVSTVDLSFRVGGQVLEMPATPGKVVLKGGIIAALDVADFNLAVRQAATRFSLARKERDRLQRLQGSAASASSLDRAEADYRVQQVALEQARLNRGYATIHAPFDALVAQRFLYEHTNVQANMAVVRVQDVTELRVEIALPQDLIGLLDKPDAYQVVGVIGEKDGLQVPLSYREHSTQTNMVGRTYKVVFGVDQTGNGGLLPGMTATVIVKPKQSASLVSVSVPVQAVDPVSKDAFQVWVVDQRDHKVSPRSVKLGVAYGERVAVLAGLGVGDQIVTAGAHLLRDGMIVEPIAQR